MLTIAEAHAQRALGGEAEQLGVCEQEPRISVLQLLHLRMSKCNSFQGLDWSEQCKRCREKRTGLGGEGSGLTLSVDVLTLRFVTGALC